MRFNLELTELLKMLNIEEISANSILQKKLKAVKPLAIDSKLRESESE